MCLRKYNYVPLGVQLFIFWSIEIYLWIYSLVPWGVQLYTVWRTMVYLQSVKVNTKL